MRALELAVQVANFVYIVSIGLFFLLKCLLSYLDVYKVLLAFARAIHFGAFALLN